MNDSSPRVLVIDGDGAVSGVIGAVLERHGYRGIVACSGSDALRRVEADRPAAVILDVAVPGLDGLSTLGAIKKLDRDIPVIVVSGRADTTTVVQAMRLGAADFLCEPFDEQVLEKPLVHAVRQRALSAELAALRSQIEHQPPHGLLLGANARVAEVQRLIDRVADTDVTVLIRGESGTGKELVARAIHLASARRGRPFVKVNCAALPTELLESELFGYERGAFTGAIQQKPGRFEFANHGTMFLDEIGELPLGLQAKLLQVLQDGEFSRLGGKADVRVDARIVAATNRDLERAVALGQFREDLFFRLNVVTIALPPLRERREDIPAFTEYFLKKFSVHYNKPRPSLSAETRDLMDRHEWPGNVRELENMVRRLIVLGSEAPVQRELARAARRPVQPVQAPAPASASAPPAGAAGADARDARHGHVRLKPDATSDAETDAAPAGGLKEIARAAARDAERVAIAAMLRRTHWNRREAAEILGISYKALLYKIKETGLDKSPVAP
jgi:two-component system, NtrC family, response regulator AtoC